MHPAFARTVCHLSFAGLLLGTKPTRALKPLTVRHGLRPNIQFVSSATSKHRRQLTAAHNHTRVHNMQTQSWQYPKPLYFPSKTKHTATVIILHGLGDTANGWADFAPMLQMQLPHVKFVFPTAPTRPITLNGGMKMTGWFDILSLDKIKMKEDQAGLEDAQRNLESLIEAEISQGIASKRVLIAGFSQGGAVSMLMLRSRMQVAAVLGMSTWLPLAHEAPIVSAENQDTPVLMCHGNQDGVVKYAYGQESYKRLKAAGSPIDFKTYQGLGHGVDPKEVQDITAFILKHVPSN